MKDVISHGSFHFDYTPLANIWGGQQQDALPISVLKS